MSREREICAWVVKALATRLGREVAVKVITERLAQDAHERLGLGWANTRGA